MSRGTGVSRQPQPPSVAVPAVSLLPLLLSSPLLLCEALSPPV